MFLVSTMHYVTNKNTIKQIGKAASGSSGAVFLSIHWLLMEMSLVCRCSLVVAILTSAILIAARGQSLVERSDCSVYACGAGQNKTNGRTPDSIAMYANVISLVYIIFVL